MATLQVHPSNGHEKKQKSGLIRIRSWGKKDKDRKSPCPPSDEEDSKYLSVSPSSDRSGSSPHSPGISFKGFKWSKKGRKSPQLSKSPPKSPRDPPANFTAEPPVIRTADADTFEMELDYHPMVRISISVSASARISKGQGYQFFLRKRAGSRFGQKRAICDEQGKT
jgi:hypothetical protein